MKERYLKTDGHRCRSGVVLVQFSIVIEGSGQELPGQRGNGRAKCQPLVAAVYNKGKGDERRTADIADEWETSNVRGIRVWVTKGPKLSCEVATVAAI